VIPLVAQAEARRLKQKQRRAEWRAAAKYYPGHDVHTGAFKHMRWTRAAVERGVLMAPLDHDRIEWTESPNLADLKKLAAQ
jgi:hypothetical protein